MAYNEFHINHSDARSPKSHALLDEDGASLYETDYGSLLLHIIRVEFATRKGRCSEGDGGKEWWMRRCHHIGSSEHVHSLSLRVY